MEFRQLRQIAYAHCQDWRAIDRFLNLPEFDVAWQGASDAARTELFKLVETGDRTGVSRWLRDQEAKKLEGKSLRELRALARHACILNYSLLSKDELISALGGS